MKKQVYLYPTTEIVELTQVAILCASTQHTPTIGVGSGTSSEFMGD